MAAKLGRFRFIPFSKHEIVRMLARDGRFGADNAGVFFHLVDAAEEEECKEAFLGYYFLAQAQHGLTQQTLDEQVERWFAQVHATELDFEVDDALDKLKALELVVTEGTGESAVYQAVGLDEACRRLDLRWDNLFRYNVQ